MFFLGGNFVFSLIWALKSKKPKKTLKNLKNLKNLKTFSKNLGFFQPCSKRMVLYTRILTIDNYSFIHTHSGSVL